MNTANDFPLRFKSGDVLLARFPAHLCEPITLPYLDSTGSHPGDDAGISCGASGSFAKTERVYEKPPPCFEIACILID